MINLTINDRLVSVESGLTVLEAARQNEIYIPTLCYHKDLTPYGGCRLCNVQIKGARTPLAACTLPVCEGMVVVTDNEEIYTARQRILELLFSNYYQTKPAVADNELLKLAEEFHIDTKKFQKREPHFVPDSDPNPVIRVDLNQCILCTRCIRACAEIQGRFVWGLVERGIETHLSAGDGVPLLEARCESCGACAVYCPTGALQDRLIDDGLAIDKKVMTTCAYCGVGCNFDLNIHNDEVVRITSNPEAKVNGLHLCVKGRYGFDYIHHPERLLKPMVRKYLLADGIKPAYVSSSPWVEIDWDTAYFLIAKKIVAIKQGFGSDAIGLLSSAKCTNEENYLMNKFARQVIGTHNIDHCARLCHSSTVAGLATAFGSGAMSNTMQDIYDHASAIFIIGSNITEQHPVFGSKIRQAVLQKKTKLIVADPRKIDITEFASIHLQHRPGTDIPLLNGLMHILIKKGRQNTKFIEDRCLNYDEFAEVVETYTPEIVSQITGVPVELLYQAAAIMAENHPMAVFWAMGITQHTTGVLNVFTLANLQMLLGNMGIPGGGVNPLRGQNNVQGACDLGALPDVFPGYQKVIDPTARLKFEQAWHLGSMDVETEPRMKHLPGLTVTEMISKAGEGILKALYIMAEDPLMTEPDLNHAKACLQNCELVILQEIFPTETSEVADILLPGVTFAEKDGTFTNTERRVQRVRQAISTRGESKPDWVILQELARAIIEIEERTYIGELSTWDYQHPAQIMDEIAALTPSYQGVSFARLDAGEQLHWPVKDKNHTGTPILHVNSFSNGKGIFHPTEHIPARELPDHEYPFTLTTGRVLYHWHGGEMTRRTTALLELYPQALIEISPEDSALYGIENDRMIKVSSRRGEMTAKAIISDRVAQGLIFANFHFPQSQNANLLTISALDPVAKIPEYKICAVKLAVVA